MARITRSRTILLVEDNPDDIQLTLRAFKRSNVIETRARFAWKWFVFGGC